MEIVKRRQLYELQSVSLIKIRNKILDLYVSTGNLHRKDICMDGWQ